MQRVARKTSLALALTGLLVAGIGAIPAHASTFLAMDIPQLVTNSDSVVQGRVLKLDSHWDAEGRVIVTDVLLQVEEAVAGATAGEIWVRTFGGQVGDYIVEAIGFPRFEEGERVLLFLNQRHGVDDTIRVTGFQLGHYRIVERNGEEFAVPTLEEGVSLITKSGQAAIAPQVRSLAQLKSEISLFARRAPRPRPSN